jgi:hypothetical protein
MSQSSASYSEGTEDCNPDWCFLWFPPLSPFRHLKLGRGRSHPHHLQFIIHIQRAMIVISVWRLAKGWTPGFSAQSKRLFSTIQRPASSLLSKGHRRLFTLELSGQDVKLTTHLHLVPRSGMVKPYLHSLIHLHGVLLN